MSIRSKGRRKIIVNGNVVSVSATELEEASFLLIEADEKDFSFEHINIMP